MAKDPKQKASPEKKEILEQLAPKASPEIEQGIQEVGKSAEKVKAIDPNIEQTRLAATLDASESLKEQQEGFGFLENELTNVLVRIKKKYPKRHLHTVDITELNQVVRASKIKLKPSEVVALNKVDEIISSSGKLHDELIDEWPIIIENVEDSSEGLGVKYMKAFNERPGETIALSVAAIGGIYLGIKALKWLGKKAFEKGKNKAKEKLGLIGSYATNLGILGIVAGALYLGRDGLRELVYKNFRINLTDQKTQDLLKKLRKGELPKELRDLEKGQLLSKEQVSRFFGDKTIPPDIQKALEDDGYVSKPELDEYIAGKRKKIKKGGLLGLLGAEAESPETHESNTRYQEFIEEKTGLEVNSVLFSHIGSESYEDFIKEAPNLLESASFWFKFFKGDITKDRATLNKIILEHGGQNLVKFFTKMIKNEGVHEEFRGKSINEVMEEISKNPEKYIDKEAIEKANEKDKDWEEFKIQFAEFLSKPNEKVVDTDFMSKMLFHLAASGGTMFIDNAQKAGVWILHNGTDAAFFESEIAFNFVKDMADRFEESDNKLLSGFGSYLQVGAYSAAIGAPIGSGAGFVTTYAKTKTLGYSVLKGGIGGGISGARKAVIDYPLKGVWKAGGIAKQVLTNDFHPSWDIQKVADRHLFILEDLSVGKTGSLGKLKTFPQQIIDGEVGLSDKTIRKLRTQLKIAGKRKEEMAGKATKAMIGSRAERLESEYRLMYEQIDRILSQIGNKEGTAIDQSKWNKLMNGVQKEYALTDDAAKYLDGGLEGLSKTQKALRYQLGTMLLWSKEHPISKLVKTQPNKASSVFKLLDSNTQLLSALKKYPEIMSDHEIEKALSKIDELSPKKVNEVIAERTKSWKKFSRAEIKAIRSNPQITKAFTELDSAIEAQREAIKGIKNVEQLEAAKKGMNQLETLRGILASPKSEHAQFLYSNLDRLMSRDAASAQKALDHFLSIDPEVLKEISKHTGESEELAAMFSDYGKNQGRIEAMVAKYETKLGFVGRSTRRLRQFKVGIYDAVAERTSGMLEKGGEIKTGIGEWVESKQWYQNFEQWNGPKFRTGAVVKLAQMKDETEIIKFLKTKKMSQEAAETLAPKIKNLESVDEVVQAIKEVGGVENVRFSPKMAQALKGVKVLGTFAAASGVILSGYESYSAFSEATETSDEDRRNILVGKGGMWTANLIADGAGTYVLGAGILGKGAAGGVMSTLGSVALPLIPATYMGTGVVESMYERTKTVKEWAETDYKQLIHDWISTNSDGAGDAYREFFTLGYAEPEKEKQETREKIVTAILNMEEGLKPNSPRTKDRLHYLKTVTNLRPRADYAEAQNILRDSRTYAEIMAYRRVQNPKIDEEPGKAKIAVLMEEHKTKAIDKIDEGLMENFDAFSDKYLTNLYCESLSYLQTGAPEISENEAMFTAKLRNYLIHKRGVNVGVEYLKYAANIEKNDLESLKKEAIDQINQFQTNPNEALAVDLKNQKLKPEVNAMYELAKSFGFSGNANETELREFFDEEHKSVTGVYWSGDNWAVNDNYGIDETMGRNLDRFTVNRIIKEFKEDPKDIFGYRSEAIVDLVTVGGRDLFLSQANRVRNLLEHGLKKEVQQKKELKPTHSSSSPKKLAA